MFSSENDQIQVIGAADEDHSLRAPGRSLLAALAVLATLAAGLLFFRSGASDQMTTALGTTTTIALQTPRASTTSTIATAPRISPERFLVKINIVESDVATALRQDTATEVVVDPVEPTSGHPTDPDDVEWIKMRGSEPEDHDG